jgi:hypothetical protein
MHGYTANNICNNRWQLSTPKQLPNLLIQTIKHWTQAVFCFYFWMHPRFYSSIITIHVSKKERKSPPSSPKTHALSTSTCRRKRHRISHKFTKKSPLTHSIYKNWGTCSLEWSTLPTPNMDLKGYSRPAFFFHVDFFSLGRSAQGREEHGMAVSGKIDLLRFSFYFWRK